MDSNDVAYEFIGRSKKSAQDLAEQKNMIFHLVRIDDRYFFPYPGDKREDRICVELENGKVVVAKLN